MMQSEHGQKLAEVDLPLINIPIISSTKMTKRRKRN